MCRIESDLLCELIVVFPNQILSIKTHFLHRSPSVEVNLTMLNAYARSYSTYQFSKYSQQHLAHLIAHTRTHDIFDSYCARITLHQAHLAHTLGFPWQKWNKELVMGKKFLNSWLLTNDWERLLLEQRGSCPGWIRLLHRSDELSVKLMYKVDYM